MRFTRIVALALAISTLSSSISFVACWNDTASTDKYFMIESSTEHYELGGTYA